MNPIPRPTWILTIPLVLACCGLLQRCRQGVELLHEPMALLQQVFITLDITGDFPSQVTDNLGRRPRGFLSL